MAKLKKPPHQQESNDAYEGVLLHLDESARIVRCNADTQYILQRKQGQLWHGKSYCVTKEALIRDAGYLNQSFSEAVEQHFR
mgnify:CR=1 FL=1